MDIAEPQQIFIKWDSYQKKYLIAFRVRCPYADCRRVNRFGCGFHAEPKVYCVKGVRTCDHCGEEFAVNFGEDE